MSTTPSPKSAAQISTLPQGESRNLRLALWIVIAVTAVRVLVLILTPLQLYPDEAQYWWWAQTPDWGYFSKPPMIAWIIRLTTLQFGNSEWAIRLASPLLHGATAMLVFGIARLVFNVRTGFWSALAYLTTPGISYSSGLISTDVPLLFFWAVALYAFLRAQGDPSWRWAILCGVAVGLGFETKYAMAYFFLGAAIAAVLSPDVRRLVLSWRGLAILAIGLALLAPNIAWNAAHGFPTVAHTGHNADWNHARFNPLNILSFLGGQFGVFGPILMAALLLALWRLARTRPLPAGDVVLAAFSVPVIVLITAQSFISEANANWAAVAYVGATPLAVAALLGLWRGRALWASFAIAGVALLGLWAIQIDPGFADRIGQGNAFKRLEGWRDLGRAVMEQSMRAPYVAVVAANRSTMAELLYYARPQFTAMRMWDRDLHDDDHFQMTMRLTRPAKRVLLVISPDEKGEVLPTFDSATLVEIVTSHVGGRHTRTTELYDAQDYRGPQTPAPRIGVSP
jgi:Dolichyl-phosphate-mannose-protein mannosyltransferase